MLAAVTSALVITEGGPQAPALEADLAEAGIHVLGACPCDKLVQQTLKREPDVVVCWAPHPDDTLFQALSTLATTKPVPVLVFTDDVRAEAIDRAGLASAWMFSRRLSDLIGSGSANCVVHPMSSPRSEHWFLRCTVAHPCGRCCADSRYSWWTMIPSSEPCTFPSCSRPEQRSCPRGLQARRSS